MESQKRMKQVVLDIPDSTLSALRQDPKTFADSMRLAAAVKWYELGRLSQERAAELAGLSRRAFLDELGRWGVSAVQSSPDELKHEAGLG